MSNSFPAAERIRQSVPLFLFPCDGLIFFCRGVVGMRPLIGIPCHSGFREGSGRPIYCNNRVYVHAVEQAGGVPILIPVLNDVSELDTLLPRLDGLLLPGGLDVHPSLYGEEPHPLLTELDPKVDEMEFELVRWALKEDIPTLGICRGMQLLNVAL